MLILKFLVPAGLSTELGRQGGWGYFEGRALLDENLFIAEQGRPMNVDGSTPDPQDIVRNSISESAREHWAYVKSNEDSQLLYLVVKPGLLDVLRGSPDIDFSGFVEHIPAPSFWPSAALDENGNFTTICCLEPFEEAYLPYVVIVESHTCQAVYKPFKGELLVRDDFPQKFQGLSPIEALQTKSITIVGVGSIGSAVALNLAAAGVGEIHIVDPDVLSQSNLHRHACDRRHIGRYKVAAVRDLIHGHRLPTKVFGYAKDILHEPEGLWRLARETDLVIAATDSRASRRLLNYVAIRSSSRLILGCAFENAQIGEIIRVGYSDKGACYECTRLYLQATGALEPPNGTASSGRIPYDLSDTSRSEREETGTRVDVGLISHVVSRIAVMSMLGDGAETSDGLPANYLAWGTTPVEGLGDPFSFPLPFGANWLEIPKQEGCPVCGQAKEIHDPEIEAEYDRLMAALH